MKFEVVLFLAAISTAHAQCERAFNIDFTDAELATNTLHEGGELKFDNVGTYLGVIIDLVVTVVPGTTYTIPNPDLNGVSGLFGQINVQNRPIDPDLDGVGEFDFCFQENGSGASVRIESFDFTIFDLDGRGDRGFEKFTIDPVQYVDFQLSGGQTEVDVQCESTNPPPCVAGESLCFISTTSGGDGDNPNDPDDLTPEQLNRSVLFTFRETSCFRASFAQLCNEPGCSIGGNLIFGGSAEQLVDCDPTENPTRSPTRSPTRNPTTPSPTPAPLSTPNPTPGPVTPNPTRDRSTPSPTNSPTNSPTPPPVTGPTRSPTRNPTPAPGPVASPTPVPTRLIEPTSPISTPPVSGPSASGPSMSGSASTKSSKSSKSSKKDKKPKSISKKMPKLDEDDDDSDDDASKKSPKKRSKSTKDKGGGAPKGPKVVDDVEEMPFDSEDMPFIIGSEKDGDQDDDTDDEEGSDQTSPKSSKGSSSGSGTDNIFDLSSGSSDDSDATTDEDVWVPGMDSEDMPGNMIEEAKGGGKVKTSYTDKQKEGSSKDSSSRRKLQPPLSSRNHQNNNKPPLQEAKRRSRGVKTGSMTIGVNGEQRRSRALPLFQPQQRRAR